MLRLNSTKDECAKATVKLNHMHKVIQKLKSTKVDETKEKT